MRIWKPTSAIPALSLALGMAASAHAGLIPAGISNGPSLGHWTLPVNYHRDDAGYWAFHRPARGAHGLDLRALLEQYSKRTHSTLPEGFRAGAPGAGLSQLEPVDSDEPDPIDDDEDQDSDDDESGTEIAAQGPGGPFCEPRIPAVPEPGSLAMFGAGALGLLAARAVLKDRG